MKMRKINWENIMSKYYRINFEIILYTANDVHYLHSKNIMSSTK